jgi:hypothetical protein
MKETKVAPANKAKKSIMSIGMAKQSRKQLTSF